MWIYDQSSGELSRCGLASKGYSGLGRGKNNPSMQAAVGVGPIPAGKWKIGAPVNSPNIGPYALPLTPCEGTQTFGRTAFFMHGDSISNPGEASHGCIIMPRKTREQVWNSGDNDLTVIA